MTLRVATLLLILAVHGGGASAAAASAPVALHAGAAYVEKSGMGKRAVILLPGLGYGTSTFAEAARELARRYTVYGVTFAGFDGKPRVAGPYLETFEASILELIARERLDQPILIGHSFGAHIALRLAAEHAGVVGGVVAADVLPLFPPNAPGTTLVERRTALLNARDGLLNLSAPEWDKFLSAITATQAADPAQVQTLQREVLKADRATYVNAFVEWALDDLAPLLPRINVPTMVLASVPSLAQSDGYHTYFTGQFAGAPALEVVTVAPSHTFMMLDQPGQFARALDGFLTKNAPP